MILFFRIAVIYSFFTVTLSIYHLVINPINIGVFRLKLPASNLASNLLLQGSTERNYLLKNVKNLSFLDV